MDIISYIIFFLLFFLIGFSSGRRIGYKNGFKEGRNFAPIDIRKQMLKIGKCPICDNKIED